VDYRIWIVFYIRMNGFGEEVEKSKKVVELCIRQIGTEKVMSEQKLVPKYRAPYSAFQFLGGSLTTFYSSPLPPPNPFHPYVKKLSQDPRLITQRSPRHMNSTMRTAPSAILQGMTVINRSAWR